MLEILEKMKVQLKGINTLAVGLQLTKLIKFKDFERQSGGDQKQFCTSRYT